MLLLEKETAVLNAKTGPSLEHSNAARGLKLEPHVMWTPREDSKGYCKSLETRHCVVVVVAHELVPTHPPALQHIGCRRNVSDQGAACHITLQRKACLLLSWLLQSSCNQMWCLERHVLSQWF